MEKTIPGPTSKRPRRSFLTVLVAVALLSAYLLSVKYEVRGHPFNASHSPAFEFSEFNWRKLSSSRSLRFEYCFGDLSCARLSVPLDWSGSEAKAQGKQVSVAIVRIAAKVPVTDPRYGGPILINPGGPGGSGIGLALAIGKILQQVVDAPHNLTSGAPSSSGKYYDIIGFDPRGVNNTTPAANCFPDDSSLSIWLQRADAQGFPYSNETFANSWSRHASFAGSCTWRLGDDDDNEVMGIGRYLNTPSVVEDMRAIVGALGEWRESEAKRQADLQNVQLTAEVREATRWRRGEEKLLYMGFSYGTLLGATFAAMHPDKVGRVVLDAVVDAEDYYSARWMKNLQDADSILETFFRECHLAGKEKCAISSPTDPEHPKRVYYGVLEALKEAPMIVPGHDDIPPNILTYHDLMQAVVSATYNPYPLFRPLANILHGLSLTNGTLLSEAKRAAIPVVCQSPTCKQHPWSMQCQDPGLNDLSWSALHAILCSDGKVMSSWTQHDHYQKWQALISQSSIHGGRWSEITMPCSNWGLRPVWSFNRNISANTAHPILWLSNTRDPVTPLRNALYMQTKFPGSVVVQQEADGHGTFSRPGICISKVTRQYFQDGLLPEPGLICKSDLGPFDDRTSGIHLMNEFDRTLLEASEGIALSRRERHWPLGF